MREAVINTTIVVVITAVFVVILEAFSLRPYQELDDATVLSVEEGRQGFWGDESRTWIRFDDGMSACKSGRLGKAGEKVRAWRQTGVASLFGWMGDVSDKEARRRERASMRIGEVHKKELSESTVAEGEVTK